MLTIGDYIGIRDNTHMQSTVDLQKTPECRGTFPSLGDYLDVTWTLGYLHIGWARRYSKLVRRYLTWMFIMVIVKDHHTSGVKQAIIQVSRD